MKKPPTDERIQRICERLEARKARKHGGSATLEMLPGETPHEAVARAKAAGRQGGFLILPPPVTPEEWERSCATYHQWLMSRVGHIAENNYQSPSADEIKHAYECARANLPMPE